MKIKHRFILLTLQLINGISSDLQKLLGYFNGKGIAKFLEIPFAWWPSVSPNNLALNMEDLNLMSAIFYQILIFSPNNSPSKTMKKVFNFIEKALFVLERFQVLHFFLFLSTFSRFKKTNGQGIVNNFMSWLA